MEFQTLWGSQYMAGSLGKRSLFLSVPVVTYLRKKSICISTYSFLSWPTPSGLNISLSTCAVLELSRIPLLASLQLLMLGTVSLGAVFD